MFKQLTNSRPPASTDAELTTTPTSGVMKITPAAASLMKVNKEDFLAVLEEEDTNSEWYGQWLVQGYDSVTETGENGKEKVVEGQFGNKLTSSSEKNTGTLQFSSELAYQSLKGNDEEKVIYSVAEGKQHPDFKTPLFKLTFNRKEVKNKKAKKEGSTEQGSTEQGNTSEI